MNLFIGGTGILSSASTRLALARGFQVTYLNRAAAPVATVEGVEHHGRHQRPSRRCCHRHAALGRGGGLHRLHARADASSALRSSAPLRPVHLHQLGQRLCAPGGPLPDHRVHALHSPYWSYSRDKIACEQLLMDAWRAATCPSPSFARPTPTARWVVPLAFTTTTRLTPSSTACGAARRHHPGDGVRSGP